MKENHLDMTIYILRMSIDHLQKIYMVAWHASTNKIEIQIS